MVLTIICAVLGSAGAFGLIEFLIRRHDNRTGLIVSIKKEIDEMKAEREKDRATDARRRILNASDEILHGVIHSREWWEQVLQDIDDYEVYCRSHEKYENNRAKIAIKSLADCYAERRERHDFLI